MQGLAGPLAAPKPGYPSVPSNTREVIDLTLDDMDIDEVEQHRVSFPFLNSFR